MPSFLRRFFKKEESISPLELGDLLYVLCEKEMCDSFFKTVISEGFSKAEVNKKELLKLNVWITLNALDNDLVIRRVEQNYTMEPFRKRIANPDNTESVLLEAASKLSELRKRCNEYTSALLDKKILNLDRLVAKNVLGKDEKDNNITLFIFLRHYCFSQTKIIKNVLEGVKIES